MYLQTSAKRLKTSILSWMFVRNIIFIMWHSLCVMMWSELTFEVITANIHNDIRRLGPGYFIHRCHIFYSGMSAHTQITVVSMKYNIPLPKFFVPLILFCLVRAFLSNIHTYIMRSSPTYTFSFTPKFHNHNALWQDAIFKFLQVWIDFVKKLLNFTLIGI